MTNSKRHSTLLSAQSSLRVLGASKRQVFPSPGLFVLRPFCPPAFWSWIPQIYGSSKPSATHDLALRMSACIDDVCTWMQSNRLQLNTNKTEVLWCATVRRQHQLPRSTYRVGTDAITPSTTVRDLGIFIDSDLSMQSHVQRTVDGCFAVQRQLRSIRRSVPTSVFQTLVVALVLTKLDYVNATLAGLPATLLSRLQSVLNAAARLIADLRRSAHTEFGHPCQSSLAACH